MTKIISILFMLALTLNLAACNSGTQTQESSVAESSITESISSESLSNSGSESTNFDGSGYREKYIGYLLDIEFSENDMSRIIDHGFIIPVLVSELLMVTDEPKPETFEEGGVYYFEGEATESIMQRYYGIDPAKLRTSASYNADVKGYAQPEGLGGFAPTVTVLSAETEGDILTLVYELDFTELGNPEHAYDYYEMIIKLNSDGSFTYLSNSITTKPATV